MSERLKELWRLSISDVAVIAATDKPPVILTKPVAVRK
jgi:hypothetical protein